MDREHEIREKLISNTIRLVAEGGFEKATTKAIAHSGEALPDIKMNEVYIYRLFGSKEGLYGKAFEYLDNEFMYVLQKGIDEVGELESDTKSRLFELFTKVWRIIMENEAHCRCYLRFYYSVYYKGELIEKHNKLFGRIMAEFAPLFKEEADVKSIMHSIYTTLLDFAVRVFNGQLENSDINTPHIFNVLYCTMMTYFKDGIEIEESMINLNGKGDKNEK